MLHQQISDNLKEAMKQKDTLRVSTLRMLLAAIQNKEIALIKKETGLSDEETLQVIRSEVKKRKEAAAEFEKGKRGEMADQEKKEAEILEAYLPSELSDKELEVLVQKTIGDQRALGEKDFGAVMKALLAAAEGRVSGNRAAAAVKKFLQ